MCATCVINTSASLLPFSLLIRHADIRYIYIYIYIIRERERHDFRQDFARFPVRPYQHRRFTPRGDSSRVDSGAAGQKVRIPLSVLVKNSEIGTCVVRYVLYFRQFFLFFFFSPIFVTFSYLIFVWEEGRLVLVATFSDKRKIPHPPSTGLFFTSQSTCYI